MVKQPEDYLMYVGRRAKMRIKKNTQHSVRNSNSHGFEFLQTLKQNFQGKLWDHSMCTQNFKYVHKFAFVWHLCLSCQCCHT